jgi:plasmid stabilization system protein ParE
MSEMVVVFTDRARKRLLETLDYLYQQNLSNDFAINYISQFEKFLSTVLTQFPEAGTRMPQFGQGVRRIVYQRYSFLYQVKSNRIEILTIYRENKP